MTDYVKPTFVDEVLAAAERYNLKTNAGVSIYDNVQILLTPDPTVEGTSLNKAIMDVLGNGIAAVDMEYTTGGTSTAFTITTTGAIDLATGERWHLIFNATAGATPTLNRDAKGAKALKYYNEAGAKVACTATDIISGMHIDVVYDGTDYVVITLAPSTSRVQTLSNPNAIINGCGMINQRVTAYTLVKDVYSWDVNQLCGPDRFEAMATGTAVSAGTFNNIATANCGVTGYAFKFIAVTLTGAGVLNFRYRMEANDAKRFKNQIASFRCQVYQDTGGAINYTVFVRKANAADNFAAVTAISNSGAISVPSATPTSLPYLAIAMGDCSNGIEIEISVAAGAITTKNFEFTDIQFELGSVATPFEFRQYAAEKKLCVWYAEKIAIEKAYGYYVGGFAQANNTALFILPFAEKRVEPTVIISGVDAFVVAYLGTLTATLNLTSATDGKNRSLLSATVAAILTAGDGVALGGANSATAHWFIISAEL